MLKVMIPIAGGTLHPLKILMVRGPLRAPSVFNFYESDYAPKGEINDKALTAPEFNILSLDVMRRTSNRMWMCILSHDSTSKKKWSWDRSELEQTVNQPDEYIALVNDRLFGGLMSQELSQFLNNMLLEMALNNKSVDRKVNDTLFAVQCSPEFRCQE